MMYYVVELRKWPMQRKTYATIESKHRTFTKALKLRNKYIRQDAKRKELNGRIKYIIGRL